MATTQPAAQAPDHGAGLIAAPLIVLGGGEHARVVIEAARTQGDRWAVQGYVAPEAGAGAAPDTAIDLPWLGDDAALAARLQEIAPDDRPWLVVGFGGGEIPGGLAARAAAADRFGQSARWATVVHATAWISPSATVGAWRRGPRPRGREHRCARRPPRDREQRRRRRARRRRRPRQPPRAGRGHRRRRPASADLAFIGLGARVRDHIEIGAGAVVGMGAVVVESIEPGVTVVGIPARRHEPGP